MDKYKLYSAEDFLQDEDFIRWQLFHDENDDIYWEDILSASPFLSPVIEEASCRFKDAVRLGRRELSAESVEAGVSSLLKELKAKKRQKTLKQIYISVSVAASLILVFLASWYTIGKDDKVTEKVAGIKYVKAMPNDDITLLMGDSSITLENNAQIRHSNQGMTILDPKSHVVRNEALSDKPVMNKLIVPYGKRSSIVLADGSKLWVNAGTVVEYPNTFDGDTRKIKVDGEIFIEVAKSKDKQFIVSTSKFDVKVYGTVFDVSAYSEDNSNYVVLVEGKVSVDKNGNEITLQPNDLFKSDDNGVSLETVNVDDFISWRQGWLSIKSFSLSEVARQLSRYYNVDIKCQPEIADLKASGKLRLFDRIDDVLHVVSNNMKIEYRQSGNSIILCNKK